MKKSLKVLLDSGPVISLATIKKLRPLFRLLLENKRYFKIDELNRILSFFNEKNI